MNARLPQILITALFGVIFAFAAQAETSPQAAPPFTADQLEQQRQLKEFQEWRGSIPDYERRVYDRIKTIQKDQILEMRLIGTTIAVMLVGFAGVFFILFIRTGLIKELHNSAAHAARYRRVMDRQAKLGRAMAAVEVSLSAYRGQLQALEKDHSSIDVLLSDCRRTLGELDQEVGGFPTSPSS